MTKDRLDVLFLCDYQDDIAATVRDHIQALERNSRHRYWRLSMLGDMPSALELDRFDALIVHYTLVACSEHYLSTMSRQRIAGFRGLKAMFIQDEYRFVDATIRAIGEMGINLLFTCVPEGEIQKVYPDEKLPGVAKVNVLTGYVPDGLAARSVPPLAARKVDIGYRGRSVPAWLGRLGQEKLAIGLRVAQDAPRFGLVIDISFREEDRLYGDDWIEFVGACKAMLGVESGASVFDFGGDIQRNVENHLKRDPAAGFETLHDLYFAAEEGKIKLAQISPRCFESAALGTLMILYEGDYSGILVPWRHYVPLKKDHSNFEQVVAVLRDHARITEITAQARAEIALNPRFSFRHAVSEIDAWLDRLMRVEMKARGAPYTVSAFRRISAFRFTTMRRRMFRWWMKAMYRFLFGFVFGWAPPERRDRIHRRLRQVYYIATFHALR